MFGFDYVSKEADYQLLIQSFIKKVNKTIR